MVAANDGIADGVIQALAPRKLAGKVLVTGQDATDAGLQRILLGDQTMSVYKAIKAEAETAAQCAIALGDGDTTRSRRSPRRRSTTAPVRSLGPARSGRRDEATISLATVFKDGFTTEAKVCKGQAAARCPA